MTSSAICAIMVTFHPQTLTLENMAKIRPTVQAMVVVDNGSSIHCLAPFYAARSELDFHLIEHHDNLGIAAALNAGVRWARSRGFGFVLLFDQDSTVLPGFVDALQATYANHPAPGQVAIVMPRYIDKRSGKAATTRFLAGDGAPLEVMTSGSFIPTAVFDACGGFREELFIDQVDHEFAFRVRQHGYVVVVSSQALLLHAPGVPRQHSYFGLMTFKATHHNAMRRYYMTRNGLVMAFRYRHIYPLWSRGVAKALLLLPIHILLAETEKWAKLRNIFLGAVDALRGRLGRVELS